MDDKKSGGPGRIIGIDLGTTNSVVAVYSEDGIKILEESGEALLPSYVGLDPENNLLVGQPARNQYVLYPENTVRSIKRKMGSAERVSIGDRDYSPEEISALILRRLRERAEEALGEPIRRAVITVPAFFNDLQRQATITAGKIAGMEVERIVNEPTAAALAYRKSNLGRTMDDQELLLVYDLGGGTFDVSIIREEGGVTEVLESRGDTRLGGDDFDRVLLDHFLQHLRKDHDVDIREDRRALNRLTHAAEHAKIQLSFHPWVCVLEENLVQGRDGSPVHLDLEVTRSEYEDMIRPRLEKTLACVQEAVRNAELQPSDLDEVLLVGGSTRTPLVKELLTDFFGREPRAELHPDSCVALGAGILAARLEGQEVERILIDITPHSLGVECVTFGPDGPDPHHFSVILPRSTPLPAIRSDGFETMYDGQDAVEIRVFQGEESDARLNVLIGSFKIEGLADVPVGNEVIAKMRLDVNGVLQVSAIEKETGLKKSITIEKAFDQQQENRLEKSRRRVAALLGEEDSAPDLEPLLDPSASEQKEALDLIERVTNALAGMHPEDREEAQDLCRRLKEGIAENQDFAAIVKELTEILYFVGA